MTILKSFKYTIDENWNNSLQDIHTLIASLKQENENSIRYWEIQAADENGEYVGDPIIAFSVDAVPGAVTPTESVIASDAFISNFIAYTKSGGIDYAVARYRAIPRVKDISLAESLGISKEDIEKIRHAVSKKDVNSSEFLNAAEKALTNIAAMFSKGEQHISEGPIKVEERVDDMGMRSFYIKGTNVLHREDGPAAIGSRGAEMWMQRGQLHREDGPAVRFPDGSTAYWLDGLLHREDGPAVIEADGTHTYAIHGVILSQSEFDSAIAQELIPEKRSDAVAWTKDGKVHNANGPAMFTYNAKYWIENGFVHRLNGPAVEFADGTKQYFLYGIPVSESEFKAISWAEVAVEPVFNESMEISSIQFLNRTNELHRNEGPARIAVDGSKYWYNNGRPHRLDGPAVETADGRCEYFIHGFSFSKKEFDEIKVQNLTPNLVTTLNGKVYLEFRHPITSLFHRENGPAIIWDDGKKEWYKDGMRHRDDGGAAIYGGGGDMEFYVDGRRHNSEGLAIIKNDGDGEYWLNDCYLDSDQYNNAITHNLLVSKDLEGSLIFCDPIFKNPHNPDGPAIIKADGTKYWYNNGQLHREDGPAIQWADGTFSYYLAGRYLPKTKFDAIIENKGDVLVNGMIFKRHTNGMGEWILASEEPDLITYVNPLKAAVSLDMRSTNDILLDAEDVRFKTKDGELSVRELQKALATLEEFKNNVNKTSIALEKFDLGEIDLESIAKATEELFTESLNLAHRASKVGLIGTQKRDILDYAESFRLMTEQEQQKLNAYIDDLEKRDAEKFIDEFLDEESELEDADIVQRHAVRRETHLKEIMSPPQTSPIAENSFKHEGEKEEESFGLLSTLAGATLVALAGAAISGKKSPKKIVDKKKEKKEQVAVYK